MEAREMIEGLKEEIIALNRSIEDNRRKTADIFKLISELEKSIPDVTPESWLSPEETAKHLSISRQTVDRRLVEMEKLGKRYAGCIIREPKCVRVQLRAFMDYENYRDLLGRDKTRNLVPAFFRHV